jgi:hypothetical protein
MRPDLRAALLWDRPALIRSDGQGAREFVDAMDLRSFGSTPAEGDVLGLAAQAILDEASGENLDDALSTYRQMAESRDLDARLLGFCLLCWSGLDRDPARIKEAEEEIQRVDDPDLRARLTTKLISAAFEFHWDELIPGLFDRAREWAREGSMLSRAIENEAFNLMGGEWPQGWPNEQDPLTEYRWIGDKNAAAAKKIVTTTVEEKAKSPWTLSFSVGEASLNEPFAAEMQARWAGAIWLRSETQLQLAAHLLSGAAQGAPEWANGVRLWGLAGGRQLRHIIDSAEPHFDAGSADFIIESLLRDGPLADRFDGRAVEAAVECWDLISDSTAIALLDRFRPMGSGHPEIRERGVLWGILSLRVQAAWEKRFTALTDEEALALIETMSPMVAERLPRSAAERLGSLGESAPIPATAVETLAALIERASQGHAVLAVEDLPANVVINLAWRRRELVEEKRLRSAVDHLTDEIERIADDAMRGTGELAVQNPFNPPSFAAVELGEIPERSLNVLLSIASDPSTPRDLRYQAIRSLAAGATHDAFDLDRVPHLLEQIPEAGAEALWATYPPNLVRAAKTELAMAAGLVDRYLPLLLVLSRDADTRVRIDAIEASSLARRRGTDFRLESILLNGLFDPNTKVSQRAINAFGELAPVDPAVRLALRERLPDLFNAGDRDLRAAIGRFAASQRVSSQRSSTTDLLLRKAGHDRSAEVRMTVEEP